MDTKAKQTEFASRKPLISVGNIETLHTLHLDALDPYDSRWVGNVCSLPLR